MAFIDNLAYSLFVLSFAGFLLLYAISSIYLAYRRRQRNLSEYLKGLSVPLGLIGVYMLVSGFWGQFIWPLPGSYNMLYYDPFVSFGILLIGFALAVKYNVKLEYVGIFGLMVGIMVMIYGINAYTIGLSSAPLALLLMYLFYGMAGVFSYPASLIADRLPNIKNKVWVGWHVTLVIFWVLLLLASGLSAYIGINAIAAHLLMAP